MIKNSVKNIRESRLLSKSELAKMADLSLETIHRIENGYPCRMKTKRKILLALGLEFADAEKIFGNGKEIE